MPEIKTIDDVIQTLQNIVKESKLKTSTLGYFAALYLKVTLKVKQGIAEDFFDDGLRMEKLDIIFAKRYINAYYDFQAQKEITDAWKKAFNLSEKFWPIVLQHLLIGMNAHINLDLGIAAYEVTKGSNILNLKNDFNKINSILSSLVTDVENDLSTIYPFLKKILKLTSKFDNFLVDFSMEIARDGAWDFAVRLANSNQNDIQELINTRDKNVTETALLITNPGIIANIIFSIVRLSEKGSTAQKINDLTK
ncbi:DUF5995 family protein [Tenacibaculum jejuense]|uniref:Uncharacterized protein n=1 Tax=Tenacibaculum jejuense TaxID=584609 RepID=A0A238UFV0_9FLAO|nr:DUF5995 family protein [Tenacibaculum jejuense]SNR17324.1 conserved protein of unknown function [Tenacibaculum jejuense]